MRDLVASFLAKGAEFAPYLKMGRTQLQDAVPMTLGQEFTAFGHTMLEDIERLGEAQALIRETNMGATAIGTGITAPPGYAEVVRQHLSQITGLQLITAPDLVEATADTGAFVQLSGVLKRCARSEEHTSELQSRQYLVCRLLLEKKTHLLIHSH